MASTRRFMTAAARDFLPKLSETGGVAHGFEERRIFNRHRQRAKGN